MFADRCETESAANVWPRAIVDAPPFPDELPPAHAAIAARADVYGRRAYAWLKKSNTVTAAPVDSIAVISWFHMFIHVKVMRALHGLAEDDGPQRTWPADHDGSAKVALIGIDRSQAAWFHLATCGHITVVDAMPFIEDLMWLSAALEDVFPNARAFVRPGFDEPEEVAKLLSRNE